MPPRDAASHLVRLLVGKRGSVPMRMELVLRFDYGAIIPWVSKLADGGGLSAIAGPDMAILRTPVVTRGEDFKTLAEFRIERGQSLPFVLSYASSHLPAPEAIDTQAALDRTQALWRQWSGRVSGREPWHEPVQRSLITLKALTYRPTGGIVAAATTSLPEQFGGVRNWDYRYCWLRDATLTLLALMDAGFYDEAAAWRTWLERAVAGSPAQIQTLYGVAGERRIPELELPHLPGYEGAAPVRIGNAASTQLQLDVFGELMDVLHQARRGGLPPDDAAWALQRALIVQLEAIWQQPDEGIWEVRGGRRPFTYSKVMAWVAVDRAIKSAEQFGLNGPLEHWRTLRRRIHEDVCQHGFDPARGAFVQSYGSSELDAATLLIPLVGFLPASDARVRGTVAAVQRELMAEGFVLRYSTHRVDDGLPPGEGAFLACSFWLADNLVLQNRFGEARALFERLLGLRNDVGLLAEEYDPRSGRFAGNFPQAFSHIALVNTARNLAQAGPAQQRPNHVRPGDAAPVSGEPP
jgi:GH15 family glucan-1,4-alpha-glucosidase